MDALSIVDGCLRVNAVTAIIFDFSSSSDWDSFCVEKRAAENFSRIGCISAEIFDEVTPHFSDTATQKRRFHSLYI